jgi:hypothetical protein
MPWKFIVHNILERSKSDSIMAPRSGTAPPHLSSFPSLDPLHNLCATQLEADVAAVSLIAAGEDLLHFLNISVTLPNILASLESRV